MKYFVICFGLLSGLFSLSVSANCHSGFVAIERDVTLKMQPQGNPRGELRLIDTKKKRIIITVKNENQKELSELLKTINSQKTLCLQIDPSVFGDDLLEDFKVSTLSQIVELTFDNHYFPQLFILDSKNPFNLK